MSIENHDLIEPRELIIQEGEDAGRIADIPLAMIGAKAQYNWDDDEHGIEAMVSEVGHRAEKLTSNVSLRIKKLICEAVEKNFKLELDAKKNERQATIDAEAEALLVKLKNEELTYADLPKPHYDSSLWDKNNHPW